MRHFSRNKEGKRKRKVGRADDKKASFFSRESRGGVEKKRYRKEKKNPTLVVAPLDDLRGQLERPGVLLVALARRQRCDLCLEHGVKVFGRRSRRRRRRRSRSRRGGRRRRKRCLKEENFGSECSLC